ncbi:Coiled-coil domain-containing protein 78 [Manis javanica]|nr:Coiled-coil domain-containing protein 78 [Manis javanica]
MGLEEEIPPHGFSTGMNMLDGKLPVGQKERRPEGAELGMRCWVITSSLADLEKEESESVPPSLVLKRLEGSEVLKAGEPSPLSDLGNDLLSPALWLRGAHTVSLLTVPLVPAAGVKKEQNQLILPTLSEHWY